MPKIERKQKSTSSISLSKYFHVNRKDSSGESPQSKHKESMEVEEGEDTIPVSSLSSSRSSLLSNESQEEFDEWPQFMPTDPLGNVSQKEVAIRRKADSLGLMSHKWAKNFIERGFMNGALPRKVFYDYSRQPTRDASRGNSTHHHQKVSVKQKEKMQELREVYVTKKNNQRNDSETSISRNRSKMTSARSHHLRPASKSNAQRLNGNSRPPTRALSVMDTKVMRSGSHHKPADDVQSGYNKQRYKSEKQPSIFPSTKRGLQLQGLTQRISTRS